MKRAAPATRAPRWHTFAMPELPDVSVYLERLGAKVVGQRLERVRIGHPFLLRSVTPPIAAIEGKVVVDVERLGKRIVLAFDGDLFIVVAPDDRRPPALARSGQEDRAQCARLLRVRDRHARAHRGRQAAACVAPRGRAAAPRSRRSTLAAST